MAGRGKSRGTKRRMKRAAPQAKAKNVNGAQPPKGDPVPEGKVRRVGTETEWLASLLHNERAESKDLRAALLAKEQALVNAMISNGKLQAKVLQQEMAGKDRSMKDLRDNYGIREGVTIHKDEITGEVYFLEDAAGAKEPEADPDEDPDEIDAEDSVDSTDDGEPDEESSEDAPEQSETPEKPAEVAEQK